MIQQGRIFKNRSDAGEEVGKLLEAQYKNTHAVVLGIPRGGVVVAYEVAQLLNAELSVLITKKLPHPSQEELAIGATAEDGTVYLSAMAKSLNEETIRRIVQEQTTEIESRILRFRQGKPLPPMENRIVILVDDGIATGSTLVPAIKLCKARGAAKVIVAAPVSGTHYVPEINDLADDVVIAAQPEDFYAVGQVFEDFHNLSDEEVIALLNDVENKTVST